MLHKQKKKGNKNMNKVIFVLATLLIMSMTAFAQAPSTNNMALMFTYGGFANSQVDAYNKGVGVLYFFDQHTGWRASLGGTSVDGVKQFDMSAGIVHGMYTGTNTVCYGFVDGMWSRSEGEATTNAYGGALGLGAEFFAWPSVSFTAEYGLAVTYDDQSELTRWSLGTTNPRLGLNVYFNK